MHSTLALFLLAAVLVIAGLIGLVLPALPGAPLIFAGLLLAAWTEDLRMSVFGPSSFSR